MTVGSGLFPLIHAFSKIWCKRLQDVCGCRERTASRLRFCFSPKFVFRPPVGFRGNTFSLLSSQHSLSFLPWSRRFISPFVVSIGEIPFVLPRRFFFLCLPDRKVERRLTCFFFCGGGRGRVIGGDGEEK